MCREGERLHPVDGRSLLSSMCPSLACQFATSSEAEFQCHVLLIQSLDSLDHGRGRMLDWR